MTKENMMKEFKCNNETELHEKLANDIIAFMNEKTSKRKVEMKFIESEAKRNVTASKLGGVPFIPADGEYPVDKDCNKMYLLIQINFAEMPHLDDYPENGILQVFLSNDDCYGMNFDEPTEQDYWKIIYHEDISNPLSLEEVEALMPDDMEDADIPLFQPGKEFEIVFEEKMMPLSSQDAHFDDFYDEHIKELLPDEYKGFNTFELPQEIGEPLYNSLSGLHSQVGGYPGFTQDDPRRFNDDYKEFELLLQLDSEYDTNNSDILLWGDCGIANFFIRPEDLKNRDFSNVYYNWDCC